jgi:hypothetical protein
VVTSTPRMEAAGSSEVDNHLQINRVITPKKHNLYLDHNEELKTTVHVLLHLSTVLSPHNNFWFMATVCRPTIVYWQFNHCNCVCYIHRYMIWRYYFNTVSFFQVRTNWDIIAINVWISFMFLSTLYATMFYSKQRSREKSDTKLLRKINKV